MGVHMHKDEWPNTKQETSYIADKLAVSECDTADFTTSVKKHHAQGHRLWHQI